MIITVNHVRAAGVGCLPQVRSYFHQMGWDWREFLKNGLPEETFSNSDNAFVQQVIDVAHGK